MGDSGCAQVLQKGNAIKFLAPFGTYRYKKRFYSCGGFNTRYFLSRNKGRNPAAFSYENDISRCSAVKLLIIIREGYKFFRLPQFSAKNWHIA